MNIPPPAVGGPQLQVTPSRLPFLTLGTAVKAEPDLFPTYNKDLLTGATGFAPKTADPRIKNVFTLEKACSSSPHNVKYDDYTANPVHRFFQMWQQLDCNAKQVTKANPSGCQNDLFPWVETTVGEGSNGRMQPANFGPLTTGEGSTAMAFYNGETGDAPYA